MFAIEASVWKEGPLTAEYGPLQAWGKESAAEQWGEDVGGGHSGKQAKHKHFISPTANRHDNTDAGIFWRST